MSNYARVLQARLATQRETKFSGGRGLHLTILHIAEGATTEYLADMPHFTLDASKLQKLLTYLSDILIDTRDSWDILTPYGQIRNVKPLTPFPSNKYFCYPYPNKACKNIDDVVHNLAYYGEADIPNHLLHIAYQITQPVFFVYCNDDSVRLSVLDTDRPVAQAIEGQLSTYRSCSQ